MYIKEKKKMAVLFCDAMRAHLNPDCDTSSPEFLLGSITVAVLSLYNTKDPEQNLPARAALLQFCSFPNDVIARLDMSAHGQTFSDVLWVSVLENHMKLSDADMSHPRRMAYMWLPFLLLRYPRFGSPSARQSLKTNTRLVDMLKRHISQRDSPLAAHAAAALAEVFEFEEESVVASAKLFIRGLDAMFRISDDNYKLAHSAVARYATGVSRALTKLREWPSYPLRQSQKECSLQKTPYFPEIAAACLVKLGLMSYAISGVKAVCEGTKQTMVTFSDAAVLIKMLGLIRPVWSRTPANALAFLQQMPMTSPGMPAEEPAYSILIALQTKCSMGSSCTGVNCACELHNATLHFATGYGMSRELHTEITRLQLYKQQSLLPLFEFAADTIAAYRIPGKQSPLFGAGHRTVLLNDYMCACVTFQSIHEDIESMGTMVGIARAGISTVSSPAVVLSTSPKVTSAVRASYGHIISHVYTLDADGWPHGIPRNQGDGAPRMSWMLAYGLNFPYLAIAAMLELHEDIVTRTLDSAASTSTLFRAILRHVGYLRAYVDDVDANENLMHLALRILSAVVGATGGLLGISLGDMLKLKSAVQQKIHGTRSPSLGNLKGTKTGRYGMTVVPIDLPDTTAALEFSLEKNRDVRTASIELTEQWLGARHFLLSMHELDVSSPWVLPPNASALSVDSCFAVYCGKCDFVDGLMRLSKGKKPRASPPLCGCGWLMVAPLCGSDMKKARKMYGAFVSPLAPAPDASLANKHPPAAAMGSVGANAGSASRARQATTNNSTTVGAVDGTSAKAPPVVVSGTTPSSEQVTSATSADADAQASRVCMHCGRDGVKMFRCGGCMAARYCSRECQKSAWASHKRVCAK